MDSQATPMEGTTTTRGDGAPDLEAVLARIESRLERLEQTLAPVAEASTSAPALVSTVTDALDDWAGQHDDLDARLRTMSALVERLTRPEALTPLISFVELTEQVKPALATLTDVVDETMARAATEGMEIERLVESTKHAVMRLAQLATSREVKALLDSGMLNPATLSTLGLAARAVADAGEQPARRIGLLGALRAAGQPSVQRALGFLVQIAENVGASLESTPSLLPAGNGTHPHRKSQS